MITGILLLWNLSSIAQPCSFRIKGHVHSDAIHENLPGATVTLKETGISITTNENGDFSIENLCAKEYTLIVSHVNYDTVVRIVNVKSNLHLDFDLNVRLKELKEVAVSGARGIQRTGYKAELTGKLLDETRGLTLAQSLSRINGVTMLQTGNNISKPVIHGLHSNRILTINNGVRQEGQQWGNEHAPEIDPFVANKLTVIKGVDELKYGSDAIGGVVIVEPRALRRTAGYNFELNSLYFSNNSQYVFSGIFEQQLKSLPALTYRVQGTFKKGANIKTPGYRLNNTGNNETNFSLAAGWHKEHFNTEVYYSYFKTELGIFIGSHIGNLTDLLTAINNDAPDPTFTNQQTYKIARPKQEVQHQLLKSKTSFDLGNSRFNILLAAQYNNRKEFDVVRSSTNSRPQINLTINTYSEEITWEHPKKNNLNGILGLSAQQQNNSYTGRYLIPNYDLYAFGAYYIEKWSRNKWALQAGVRVDNKTINTTRLLSNGNTYQQYDFRFTTFAASVNAGYTIQPGWTTNLNVSMAERAPQVNELLTNGLHHGNATYEVGDIGLTKEKSLNVSLSSNVSSKDKKLVIDLNAYVNRINDFIYQQPKPDEPVLTISGAFPKIVYQSTNALMKGFDFSYNWNFVSPLVLSGKFNTVLARNLKQKDWLIWMPADRFEHQLSWNIKESKFFKSSAVTLGVQQVLEQKRVPDEKNGKQDYKAPPPGYTLMNLSFSTSFHLGAVMVDAGAACRNLLNTSYRDYLNSFRYFTDDAGRDISIRLKFSFDHNYSTTNTQKNEKTNF